MSRKLVAYFSASGITAKVAANLADAIGADLFEIVPAVRYTHTDLDWRNENSRSSIEMKNPASRPAVKTVCDNMAVYDVIFVSRSGGILHLPSSIPFSSSMTLLGKPLFPSPHQVAAAWERQPKH